VTKSEDHPRSTEASAVEARRRCRANLGPLGIWSPHLQSAELAEARDAACCYEQLGFGTAWFPEARGREAFTLAALLLESTSTLQVATGIANAWARDPVAARAATDLLAEASNGRFVFGVGVSFPELVTAFRKHEFSRPVAFLRSYVQEFDHVELDTPAVRNPAPVLLAALNPRMIEAGGETATGVHTYFVTVEHTSDARDRLGPDPILAAAQAYIPESAGSDLGAAARRYTSHYLALDHHRRNLRRFGWTDADFEAGGSDALLSALVAFGPDEFAIRAQRHLDAGADHVCARIVSDDIHEERDAARLIASVADGLKRNGRSRQSRTG
jgi:probable F420-dependent oxidoreductase